MMAIRIPKQTTPKKRMMIIPAAKRMARLSFLTSGSLLSPIFSFSLGFH